MIFLPSNGSQPLIVQILVSWLVQIQTRGYREEMPVRVYLTPCSSMRMMQVTSQISDKNVIFGTLFFCVTGHLEIIPRLPVQKVRRFWTCRNDSESKNSRFLVYTETVQI